MLTTKVSIKDLVLRVVSLLLEKEMNGYTVFSQPEKVGLVNFCCSRLAKVSVIFTKIGCLFERPISKVKELTGFSGLAVRTSSERVL